MTCALAFAIFCGLGVAGGLSGALAMFFRADIKVRSIRRGEGKPYLERWGVGQSLEQARQDRQTGAWRVRLHHFVGPDDAGHHNHPFKWAFSIVLFGSYVEEVLEAAWTYLDGDPGCLLAHMPSRIITRCVRWFNWIPAEKYHRIVRLKSGIFGFGTWTIFVTGPRVKSWGFWVPGRGNVPWRIYKAERGERIEE